MYCVDEMYGLGSILLVRLGISTCSAAGYYPVLLENQKSFCTSEFFLSELTPAFAKYHRFSPVT